MTTAPLRRSSWVAVGGALMAGVMVSGLVAWRMSLDLIDRQVKRKRGEVKKLALSGGIAPTQEVADYLAGRQAALAARYDRLLRRVTVAPGGEATADPALQFQERFHEIQQMLERLATARQVAAPELLGLPKELPPAETVPRLLVQLEIIRQAADLLFQQEVASVTSLKVEDPQPVQEGGAAFLTRVPVRVRFASSLPQLMKVLGALQQVTPLLDIRSVRIGAGPGEGALELECVLARYLVSPTPAVSDAEPAPPPPRRAKGASKVKP